MLFSTTYVSPPGRIVLGSDGESLTGLWFAGQKHFPQTDMLRRDELAVFDRARAWLDAYFAGQRPDPCALPLAPEGTGFQLLVWELLLTIPYGATTTYRDLAAEAARQMGRRTMAAQAVGGAVGRNPISIIIPCHRVLSARGDLTGYAGGVKKKIWLLRHEGVFKAAVPSS